MTELFVKNRGNMNAVFYIKAGISPNEYNRRNQLFTSKSVDRQPAGLNFYEHNWSSKEKGSVQFNHAAYSFTISNVLSTTGVEDMGFPERGIDIFRVNSGITPMSLTPDCQVRNHINT